EILLPAEDVLAPGLEAQLVELRDAAIFAVSRLDHVRERHLRVAELLRVEREDLTQALADEPDELGRACADDDVVERHAVVFGQPFGQPRAPWLRVTIG